MRKKNKNRRYRLPDELALSLGLELKEAKRYHLSKEQEKFYLSKITVKEDSNLDNTTTTETAQYTTPLEQAMPSAWSSELNKFLTIEEFCSKYGLDVSSVKSSKLVSHNAGHMTYNIAFFTQEEEVVIDIFNNMEDIIQKYITPAGINIPEYDTTPNTFDRLVITDIHIGMDVNGNGDPLYKGKWDKEELLDRLQQTIKHVLRYRTSTVLYIDDLGDYLDGLGGETTRKGHKLPQNMSDKEAFDLSLEFKISLVESLLGQYNTIVLNNVTEDNHSGIFGYFSSQAVKGILETKYPKNVTVNTIKKFIDHYSVGKHTFLPCHGKDSESLKFGFKPILDAKQIEKIDQYCKENGLYNGNYIEFSKGDSHQALYDETTSNDFHYYNYPAFSPPSNWVKTNFKNSKSGFRFYNISYDENIKIAIPYWFN